LGESSNLALIAGAGQPMLETNGGKAALDKRGFSRRWCAVRQLFQFRLDGSWTDLPGRSAAGWFAPFFLAVAAMAAEPSAPSPADWRDRIAIGDLKRHAAFLASDTLEGRQAGTRGSQAAAAYLAAELRGCGLSPAGPGNDYRQPFGHHYTNVLGQRLGADPDRQAEWIVIGAHYDHVGYGNSSNSNGPFGVIHNGADDNASGVSALLEIAESVARLEAAPARTIVFAFWDAEEVALLGSQHWVGQTPAARERVKLALNLDMIGRLRGEGVNVMGWRSASGLRAAVSAANIGEQIPFQFATTVTPDSDHQSFYAARIPVLHFDTGKHDDYHRPTDDVERLNWTGIRQIARVAAHIVVTAANAESLTPFRREAVVERLPTVAAAHERAAAPMRFGIAWNSERAAEGIIQVERVLPDYPAALAGLQPGDQLLQFGRWEQGTLSDLRTEITVSPVETNTVWRRPGQAETLSARVHLRGEPVRWGAVGQSDPASPGCLLVTQVVNTSPASNAGLQPGDLVLQMNGNGDCEKTWDALSATEEPVSLIVERDGVRREIMARANGFLDSEIAVGKPVAD
jgi:aminopeptidase YwaD